MFIHIIQRIMRRKLSVLTLAAVCTVLLLWTKPSLRLTSSALLNTTLYLKGEYSLSLSNSLYVVHSEKPSFFDRLADFNSAIGRVGAISQNMSTAVDSASALTAILGRKPDFLQRLAAYKHVKIIAMPWVNTPVLENTGSSGTSQKDSAGQVQWSSLTDFTNLPLQKYFRWAGADPLCKWVLGRTTVQHIDVFNNYSCTSDIDAMMTPISLPPIHFWMTSAYQFANKVRVPPNEDTIAYPPSVHLVPPPYALFLLLLPDGVANGLGDVISHGVKVVPDSCTNDMSTTPPGNIQNMPLHERLYVISQHWGDGTFHRLLEVAPRLAPYLQFLKSNTDVRILAPSTGGRMAEIVKILGIDPGRLVSGWNRGRVVYLPQATVCGTPDVHAAQLLSSAFRKYIVREFPSRPHNTVIVIRRTGSRRWTEQLKIEEGVKIAAEKNNLTYALFDDNPTPSFNETMQLFHSAVLVVAPHGAGLCNIVFCRPGTTILEGICNPPHVNFCYQLSAMALALRYYAVPSRGGCEGHNDGDHKVVISVASNIMQRLRGLEQTPD